jgi:hypothetical protein
MERHAQCLVPTNAVAVLLERMDRRHRPRMMGPTHVGVALIPGPATLSTAP